MLTNLYHHVFEHVEKNFYTILNLHISLLIVSYTTPELIYLINFLINVYILLLGIMCLTYINYIETNFKDDNPELYRLLCIICV